MSQESQIIESLCRNKFCLEIAPGQGSFLKIDPINRLGIEINTSLSEQLNLSGLSCINSDFFTYECNEKFDIIYARNFIEHLNPSELARFLAKCSSMLAQNGKIILITPVESVIWRTASHIRPYPPIALQKLVTLETEQYLFANDKITYSFHVESYCTFRIKNSRIASYMLFLIFNLFNHKKVISASPCFGSHYIIVMKAI